MLYVEVNKKNAETIRKKLRKLDILSLDYDLIKKNDSIFFPVLKKLKGFKTVEMKGKKKKIKPRRITEALRKILTPSELEKLKTSFDVIGRVAIIEIPSELEKKEKQIAKALMSVHKKVDTVAKKTGPMSGEYRVRKLKVVAGKKNTETLYRESGCVMKLDPAKVYFSIRLSHERERIADLVKPKEKILALFAGVGPFPLVISKRNKNTEIVAVELNPSAVKYMEENVRLNKTSNIRIIEGDVKKVMKHFGKWADRILMPLPKSAEEFLVYVMPAAKKKGVIHFYTFSEGENPFINPEKKVKEAAKKCGLKAKVIRKRIVRPYAPDIVQVVLDVMVQQPASGENSID